MGEGADLLRDVAGCKTNIRNLDRGQDELYESRNKVLIPLVGTVNTLVKTVDTLSRKVEGVHTEQIKCKERKLAKKEDELEQRDNMKTIGTIAVIIGVIISGIVAWVTLSGGHPPSPK